MQNSWRTTEEKETQRKKNRSGRERKNRQEGEVGKVEPMDVVMAEKKDVTPHGWGKWTSWESRRNR